MNMAERLEIVEHASEVMKQVEENLALTIDRIQALESERDYLRTCLANIFHHYPYLDPRDTTGKLYEPIWLRNARDAAAGKIDHYPMGYANLI